jgi:hypothetical protein
MSTTTTSTTLAKIPTKWLPQILDCIIEQKEYWIEYERANQDNNFSITQEKKKISVCKRIKRNCKGKDVISFNHMKEELQLLGMMMGQIYELEIRIDGLEGDIQFLRKFTSGEKKVTNYWSGKVVNPTDRESIELKEKEEQLPHVKFQLKAFNEYIEIIDPDKTKRSLLEARREKAYREYEAEEKKESTRDREAL